MIRDFVEEQEAPFLGDDRDCAFWACQRLGAARCACVFHWSSQQFTYVKYMLGIPSPDATGASVRSGARHVHVACRAQQKAVGI